jgi:hypothetical protein
VRSFASTEGSQNQSVHIGQFGIFPAAGRTSFKTGHHEP